VKRDRDKRAIEAWLACYNDLNGTDFRVESYPDERERTAEAIDCLCRASDGKTLGLEHTRVEAFPGEMEDNARFLAVLGQLEKDPVLSDMGFQTTASIEVGSIPTGISWATLSADLAGFLRQLIPHLREGHHTISFAQRSVCLPISIEKQTVGQGQPGSFLIWRHWPGESNDPTVEKAFQKLPKLNASNADLKILLLEQDSVAGSVFSDVRAYFESKGFPPWLPDEIWLMWSAAFETEHYMHVAQLYPAMNRQKADWKDGIIRKKYAP
jgi:hypothetical protein